jgi:PTS hybrid protein
VTSALEQADDGAGVVLLYDLGSARMVAEMAVEAVDGARLADAPLVEGAVAAAVAAQGGADLDQVTAAAEEAAGSPVSAGGLAGDVDLMGSQGIETAPSGPAEVAVSLTNEIGLHARPAALVARAMAGLDARVTVRFGDTTADGRSVLALMALGARGGDEVHVSATGPQAEDALRTFQDLAARDFDE